MTENYRFQLFFAFSSKFFKLEIGYCNPGIYTAESRPGGEHLLKIPGIFCISCTKFQAHENGKNFPKIVCLVVF